MRSASEISSDRSRLVRIRANGGIDLLAQESLPHCGVQSNISKEIFIIIGGADGQLGNDGAVFVVDPGTSERLIDVIGSKNSHSMVALTFLKSGERKSDSGKSIGEAKRSIGLISKKHQRSGVGNCNESKEEGNEKNETLVHGSCERGGSRRFKEV